jgi:hypothetical protein
MNGFCLEPRRASRRLVQGLGGAAALGLLLCLSCAGDRTTAIAREDLFTLEIGRLEDQIDLFNLEGSRSLRKTALAMRDGFFYIANGNGEKVMQYTSYGDLLFMIYNDETNPPPLSLRTGAEATNVVTRWAFPYPLREPGSITVDSRKHIYVEDRFPDERHSFDRESKALLDRMVLHFDAEGHFVEYLGREGVGGTPFSQIEGLYTSARNELAVVCRLPQGWSVYWFDPEGTVLFYIPLPNSRIPVPPDRMPLIPSVDSIAASPDGRELYIKVDYYRDIYDESTGTRTGSVPDSSIIWIMNVENGAYTGTMEVPFFEFTFTENNRQITENLLYSLLGVIRGGKVFLYFPVDEGYAILILSTGSSPGSEQHRGLIRVDHEELQFNTFCLSPEGILSGLLAANWEAKLVWWRTDTLAAGINP